MTTSQASAAAQGQGRAGWSLFLIAFAHLILTVDFTIVYVALPKIGEELGFSQQTLQWVVHGYTVVFGGFLLLGGRASDLLGRRQVFVAALLLFAAASLLGGFSSSSTAMVAARALQGLGAAFIFPSTLALINTIFAEGPQRNKAMAVWSFAGPGGLALGSLLGGVLVSAFGWEAVFLVNVPLGIAVAVGALLVLPTDQASSERRTFDIAGAITATLGVTLLVAVLVKAPEAGWTSPGILASALASAALIVGFVWIERRGSNPLMPLQLLSNRNLTTAMLLTAILMSTFMALSYFQTILFQDVLGYGPLWTGLGFLVPCLSQAVGTQLSVPLTAHFGLRTTIVTGFAIGTLGTVGTAFGIFPDGGYIALLPGMIIGYIGHGIAFGPTWVAVTKGVEPRHHGVASAMASTSFQVGGAVGMAVLVALANGLVAVIDGGTTIATADGMRLSIFAAAAGIALGGLVALGLERSSSAQVAAVQPGT